MVLSFPMYFSDFLQWLPSLFQNSLSFLKSNYLSTLQHNWLPYMPNSLEETFRAAYQDTKCCTALKRERTNSSSLKYLIQMNWKELERMIATQSKHLLPQGKNHHTILYIQVKDGLVGNNRFCLKPFEFAIISKTVLSMIST